MNIIEYCILSVIGPHAGETMDEIYDRKIKEIENTGCSFWLHKSINAKPDLVNKMIKLNMNKKICCYFISPSSKGGAQPTLSADMAKDFSKNGKEWQPLPDKIIVTGKIKGSYALVFKSITKLKSKKSIDLRYFNFYQKPNVPIEIRIGASTICCIRLQKKNKDNFIKSYERKIEAIAELVEPYCVWLR